MATPSRDAANVRESELPDRLREYVTQLPRSATPTQFSLKQDLLAAAREIEEGRLRVERLMERGLL